MRSGPKDQRINPLQAIRANTITPAYQNKVEDRLGSIEEGKLADFNVWMKNLSLRSVNPTEPLRIAKMRVATTIVGDDASMASFQYQSFASTVYAGYDQPSLEAVVTMKDSQLIDDVTAEKEYASLEANEKRFGTYSFTAEVGPFRAIFQMDSSATGKGRRAQVVQTSRQLQDRIHLRSSLGQLEMASASGQWWIGSFDNPLLPCPAIPF